MPKLAVIANAPLILGPVAFISLVYTFNSVLKPNLLISAVGMVLLLAGWGLLIRVKWPQIKAGDWSTMGVAEPSTGAYRQAYLTLLFGMLIICAANFL